MRPIDADGLLKQLAEVAQIADKDAAYTGNRNSVLTWNMAVEYIKNAPTIKIGQKKGKWIDNKSHTIVRCSYCDASNLWKSPYCPYCGADMKEEE